VKVTIARGGAAKHAAAVSVPAPAAEVSAVGSDFLKASGVQVEGRGRPMLLINGLLHGRELWEPLVRHLALDHRTVRFDFPHQNGSVFTESYGSLERYGDFVLDLLDGLGLDPAEMDAFGFSIGGDVLRNLVVERGVRFRHIIMGASGPPGIERFWKEFFTSALECLRRGQFDAFIRLIAFQFHSPLYIERDPRILNVMHLRYLQRVPDLRPLETLLNMPLQRRRPDPERDVALRGRTTLIHCLYDQLVPVSLAREYARRVGLPVHEVETGHSLLAEAPDEVAHLAGRILEAR